LLPHQYLFPAPTILSPPLFPVGRIHQPHSFFWSRLLVLISTQHQHHHGLQVFNAQDSWPLPSLPTAWVTYLVTLKIPVPVSHLFLFIFIKFAEKEEKKISTALAWAEASVKHLLFWPSPSCLGSTESTSI
jgi:hypothetical protein